MTAGQVRKAVSRSAGLAYERIIDRSGFSPQGTVISASVVPSRGRIMEMKDTDPQVDPMFQYQTGSVAGPSVYTG